ncbi:hypothetical protein DB346_24280 [Verrucomicrobia bacterium LW23]|nr:hypothetical protein DB346_24280 [Verrucomicrobia bacterium LW23]
MTDEGRALLKVLPDVILINDGWQIYAETGETPRDRVLSALYDVKLAQKAEAEVAAFDTEAGQ